MLERAGPMVRGASEVVACRLNAIAAQGETCLKRGEVGEAVIVLSALGTGICAGYELIWDEESEVGMVLDRCVEGLEACLDRGETSTRGDILGALLDIAVWERTSGGPSLLIAFLLQKRRALSLGAAIELDGEAPEPLPIGRAEDRLLQHGRGRRRDVPPIFDRRTGEHQLRRPLADAIARLLALHQPKEAAQVLAGLDEPGELTRCAELFIEHGYSPAPDDEGVDTARAQRARPRPGSQSWAIGTPQELNGQSFWIGAARDVLRSRRGRRGHSCLRTAGLAAPW